MTITGSQSYIRCSQQKLRDMAASLKGMDVASMRVALARTNTEAARRILQTLDQAVANASHNFGIGEDKVAVARILVHRGPHYKRMRAVSRGQGHAILKRTSHIVIELTAAETPAVAAAPVKAEQAEPKVEAVTTEKPVKKTVKKTATKKKASKEE